MNTPASILLAALSALSLPACGSTPSTSPPTSPTPAVVVSGTWSGTGSDSFSPERITLNITQSGTTLSGTASLDAANPADGTCGSCHKVKRGTLTGTLSGSSLTISMRFPPGGDVPAPLCEAELNATGTVAGLRMTGAYTGSDSCEGAYSNGVIDLARQ